MNKQAMQCAVQLLAQREHSAKEIESKLLLKNYHADEIATVIAALQNHDLLSDERYADSYIRARRARGYGPAKIRVELKSRGVCDATIQKYMNTADPCWLEQANAVIQKKYRGTPNDFASIQKAKQFLYYRGFTADHISQVFTDRVFDENT